MKKNDVKKSDGFKYLQKGYSSFVNDELIDIDKLNIVDAIAKLNNLKFDLVQKGSYDIAAWVRDMEKYLLNKTKAKTEKSFYKLRFIPTGNFFKPSSGYSWEKNNLSPTGKMYTRKAINFSTVSTIFILPTLLPERKNVSSAYNQKLIETDVSEWEWVEFEIKEKNVTFMDTTKTK